MNAKSVALLAAAGLIPLLVVARQEQKNQKPPAKPAQEQHASHEHHATPPEEERQQRGMVESMDAHHEHDHMATHMRWTTRRDSNDADRKRAEEILDKLKPALVRYKNYKVAIEDGYKPFHPEAAQRMVHFTSNWQGLLGAFRFDPAKPTSLLYKKSGDSYELIGAMYTAPARMSEERLNDRIPLSVATWHAHVNVCLPAAGEDIKKADWTVFGPAGSIATPEACKEANGRWLPQIYGWMIHVYPYEDSWGKIWTH